MTETNNDDYGIAKVADSKPIEAPVLPYRPPRPKNYCPRIGLIGCGGISGHHLKAYQRMGLDIVALCDIVKEKAEQRKDEFYPNADVYDDYRAVLDRSDIDVVDLATHPPERTAMLETAIDAGKHILSQKPFVLDLDFGQQLIDKAKAKNVKLAVNQNGRWAPHFSYMREAIEAGLIGEILCVHQEIDWDHSWICGTEFENVKHLILYDFAIHWFDIVSSFLEKNECEVVYSSIARSPVQEAKPSMMAHVIADFKNAQATWSFNADTRFGPMDQTTVIGSHGTLRSAGIDLTYQEVTLFTGEGHATPNLLGTWFDEGFEGAMGELLCAIEENREPKNNAASNLRSLALCFAAVASAEQGKPIRANAVRSLPSDE